MGPRHEPAGKAHAGAQPQASRCPYLEKQEDGEKTQQLCAQVFDLAEMARQPLVADRMVEFLRRSNALLTMLIEK